MTEIYMPRLSDTMEEGVISSWVKQVGDKVAPGDVLVEIETDKAVMEYEAYEEGFLVKQSVSEGDTVPIGSVIGVLGESADSAPEESGSESGAPAPDEPGSGSDSGSEEAAAGSEADGESEDTGSTEAKQDTAPAKSESAGESGSRPPSSPLARRLAKEYGLDLADIEGSGPKGRVVRADIEAAAKNGSAKQAPAADKSGKGEKEQAPAGRAQAPGSDGKQDAYDDGRASEEVKVSNIRKVIARRLLQSKQTVPHFYLRRTIDAEALKSFRADVNARLAESGVKISFNDLIVKAAATTLRRHPAVNSSWVDEKLLRHGRINVGVAVAVDEGLVVPVLHDTDKTTLSDIATGTRALAGKAREGKLKPQEMSGGTFSVSNLGMFGVDSFSAVINPPEAAILAVGAMKPEAVVRDGEVVVRNTIALELSVDHRAVDGAVGAAFLKDLAETLEEPLRIIV